MSDFGAVVINIHEKWDVMLWLTFLAGQCVYILKRAAMAIRSKTNPISSRRAFLFANWDILTIRTVIEFIFPYYPLRHLNVGTMAGLVHFQLPAWIPPDSHIGGVGFFACGISADVLLDWAGQSEKVPLFVRQFIMEQIPNVNGNEKKDS